jgi:hypothetical protein
MYNMYCSSLVPLNKVRGIGRDTSKVPRQYPFVLLVEVRLRKDKDVGSEEG